MSRPISKHKKGFSARPNSGTRKTKKPADITEMEKNLEASLHRGFRISRNHAPNNYFNKTTAFRFGICHQSRNI
ncbi:hypothetical protein IMCC14465_17210 [alpha proteobacterium IMCC14465]|uniref:Uncharacterized protein n=1 Tax=alpha proteobacterium IMCC14465 TaxID=1220535 RepID=J9A2K5_9PROT|nr:hypothetical protein IMCC14465_17210 [alpha proteobacterium IMCC14465]